MSTDLEQDEYPKKNPLITGKSWKMKGIGSVMSYDVVKANEHSGWKVQFMNNKTMDYDEMDLDDFLNNCTPLFHWLGQEEAS